MKKIIALLLACMMVLGLAACGESGNNTTTAGSNNTTTAGSNNDTTAANGEKPEVSLTLWGAQEDQEMLRTMCDEFIAAYADQATITIEVGVCGEGDAKSKVLEDVEAAADVFTFADDQINELVAGGALLAVPDAQKDDITNRNVASSVDAATVNGSLYAYPMTADNGYFMFYNKEYFTEEDVQTLDRMLEVAAQNGKYVTFPLANGWYLYSFFAGAGLELSLNEDGASNYCNWNTGNGTKVVEAILNIASNPGFRSDDVNKGFADGSYIAGVSGTWDAEKAAEAWGENYAACKLPTYTLDGKQVQMSSFSGCKLVGVNAYSQNKGYACLLADWITNEQNQATRFATRKLGPSNINVGNSDAVQADPSLSALAAQAAYATPQRVANPFWDPAAALGQILAMGNVDGTPAQTLLDNAVAGITAVPVE